MCLYRQLPNTLLKYLGATNISSYERLGPIIIATTLFVVDDLLIHDGIIEIEGIERSVEDVEYNSDAPSNQGSSPQHQNVAGSLDIPSHPLNGVAITSSHSSRFTPASSVSRSNSVTPERPDLYNQLLDAVIRQAEEISDLPNIKETIASRLPAVFGLDTWLAVQSPHDGEEKFKIGAAGELFVSLPIYDCLIQ